MNKEERMKDLNDLSKNTLIVMMVQKDNYIDALKKENEDSSEIVKGLMQEISILQKEVERLKQIYKRTAHKVADTIINFESEDDRSDFIIDFMEMFEEQLIEPPKN